MMIYSSSGELGHKKFHIRNTVHQPCKPLFSQSRSVSFSFCETKTLHLFRQDSKGFVGFKTSSSQVSENNKINKVTASSDFIFQIYFDQSFVADRRSFKTKNVEGKLRLKMYCHIGGAVSPKPNGNACGRKGYGGSLPVILRRLETQENVEDAMNLWVGKLSPKEQTVILKEQKNWRRILHVFWWMKSQVDYVPNVIHYNIVLRVLGRAKKWDELRLCWIEMEKDGLLPTNNTYGMLIDVYGKAGLVKEALLWLKHMKSRGIFPDEVTMNTLVRVLKDCNEFDRAEIIYKDWCLGKVDFDKLNLASFDSSLDSYQISPKHFLLTELFKSGGRNPNSKLHSSNTEVSVRKPRLAATYNTLIDLYGKAGRLKDASQVFAEMLKEGIMPDTITFNTMIFTCGSHGLLSEAEILFSKMEERGLSPDTKTYNILLSLYINSGNTESAQKCYSKIREAGLFPDTVTHRIILQMLCEKRMIIELEGVIEEMEKFGVHVDEQSLPLVVKMYIDEGLRDKAKNFLQKHLSHGHVSSQIHAAILDVYAEKSLWNEAENLFFQKRDLGLKIDILEYNVMFKVYGKVKLYDKAMALFESMKVSGTWPDSCTYNSLIQMLSSGELTEAETARSLLIRMQESGLKPRCATFSAVIAQNVRLCQVPVAVEIYNEMVRSGVEPNEVVYGSLINGFAQDGLLEESLRYLLKMEASGLTVNKIILTSLIKAYSKKGLWEKAQEIYGKMKDLEGGPDCVASNYMINLFANLGMVYEAESIFEKLKQNGQADSASFAIMMYLYKNMGMIDEAIHVAREMQRVNLLTDCTSFSNAMAAYALNGHLKECGELLNQMVKKRVSPDISTFKVALTVLKKGGFSHEAVTELEESYKDGKPYAREAIITSVFCVSGLHDCALESCEKIRKAKVKLDTFAYNVLIYAYGVCGKVDKALNIFMKMQDENLETDLVTYINLVGCYGKARLIEGVKRVYNQLKYGEIELNESLFMAISDAYIDCGRRDLAQLVNQEMRFTFQMQQQNDSGGADEMSS